MSWLLLFWGCWLIRLNKPAPEFPVTKGDALFPLLLFEVLNWRVIGFVEDWLFAFPCPKPVCWPKLGWFPNILLFWLFEPKIILLPNIPPDWFWFLLFWFKLPKIWFGWFWFWFWLLFDKLNIFADWFCSFLFWLKILLLSFLLFCWLLFWLPKLKILLSLLLFVL